MKLKINIKDSKVAFFIELVKNLDFVDIDEEEPIDDILLSDSDKAILDKRMKAYLLNSNEVLDWKTDVVKKIIN